MYQGLDSFMSFHSILLPLLLFLSFPFLFFLCLMKHYIYLSPVYEHSFFVKSSQSDVKWNERRVNGFPVIWSEIMGDNWGNEQWNYRVNLSRGNGWILIEFLQFVIFETCYKNWGKSALSFFYAIPSEVDNSHLFLSFFFFYKIYHLLFIRYYFVQYQSQSSRKDKKNSDFPSWSRRFQCASKRIHSGNVENYIETEKNGWFVATNLTRLTSLS